jgi:hypothetical protein
VTRIIIRAVPERQEMIDYLRRHLPDAEWCIDTERRSMTIPRWNLHRALDLAGDDPVVHMEEDALLTRDFRRRLEDQIAARPDNVIQFFSMRPKDLILGSRWDRNYCMFQCTYFPAGYSRAVREFERVWKERDVHFSAQDYLVRDFLKSRREAYWIVVPSLVDHREAVSVLDRRRSSKRQSLTFREPM